MTPVYLVAMHLAQASYVLGRARIPWQDARLITCEADLNKLRGLHGVTVHSLPGVDWELRFALDRIFIASGRLAEIRYLTDEEAIRALRRDGE